MIKRKPQPPLNPSPVQQQPLMNPALNPVPSLVPRALVDRSASETALLIAYNLAATVATPALTRNAILSHSGPASSFGAKDTAVHALQLLLEIGSDTPRLGIKAALSGLLTITESIHVCWGTI